jgi:hypothetical protein
MDIDEGALTRFFGSPAQAEGKEEQAFFGARTYRLQDGPYTLTMSLHTRFGDASLHLAVTGRDEPLLQSLLTGIAEVRVAEDPALLTLHGRAPGSTNAEPALSVRATLTLDPLAVRLEDGMD